MEACFGACRGPRSLGSTAFGGLGGAPRRLRGGPGGLVGGPERPRARFASRRGSGLHLGLWGGDFLRLSGAPSMTYCVLLVPIWSWVPRCAILGGQWAKKWSFIIIVLFLAFCALKSRFLSLSWGFNPLLRPKVPPRSPYGLIPLSSCIASATNHNTDIDCEFGSFFCQFLTL